jgi:hypothetical protein
MCHTKEGEQEHEVATLALPKLQIDIFELLLLAPKWQ